jgi:hypothetical protein
VPAFHEPNKDRKPVKWRQLVLLTALMVLFAVGIVLVKPWYPIVRFDSEVIRVTVDPARVTVDGLYRLYNPLPFPITQWIYYPTPVGGGLKPADRLSIELLPGSMGGDPQVLHPEEKRSGEFYGVKVPGRGVSEVRAVYSQLHNGAYGRYILTTTAGWGRPLRHAVFELTLDSLELFSSNYEVTKNGDGKWTFERREFMPQEDWVFRFKKKAS